MMTVKLQPQGRADRLQFFLKTFDARSTLSTFYSTSYSVPDGKYIFQYINQRSSDLYGAKSDKSHVLLSLGSIQIDLIVD